MENNKTQLLREIVEVKTKIRKSIENNDPIKCREYIKTLKRLIHLSMGDN